MEQHSCLSFAIDCDVLWKGLGVMIAGFILFVGSVYLLLAAIFGRWMGYLVLAVAFFGWMTIQSGLWLFGFWSQGPDDEDQPRAARPRRQRGWSMPPGSIPVPSTTSSPPTRAGNTPSRTRTDPSVEADVQAAQGVVAAYMAKQANAAARASTRPRSTRSCPTQFVVDDLRFATAADGTKLAVAQAHYSGGGPSTHGLVALRRRTGVALLGDVLRDRR